MADAAATPFVMHGARNAIAGGLAHIEEHVKGIELAVNGKSDNLGLAFDLSKTVIETACKTILSERGIAFQPSDDLPKLFRTVTHGLPFLPVSESSNIEVRRSLVQTLNGLSTAVQGVCELRNACGFASHGSDAPRPVLETVQAILAAETADAIVGFLHRVHKQDRPLGAKALPSHDAEFNDYVDDSHDRIRIFDEEFAPSKILFELAPEPYRMYLSVFRSESRSGDESPRTAHTEEQEP